MKLDTKYIQNPRLESVTITLDAQEASMLKELLGPISNEDACTPLKFDRVLKNQRRIREEIIEVLYNELSSVVP